IVEYTVKGAVSEADARQIVRTVSDSSLVKTALFGRDPNWGRILAAAGRAGVPFDPERVDLHMGTRQQMVPLIQNGQPVELEQNKMKKILREPSLFVELHL